MGRILAVLALVFLVTPAQAQFRMKDYVGDWKLSLHGKHCVVKFTGKPVHGAYGLTQKCPDTFPMQSVAAWKAFDGGILFVSDTGAPVVTFQAAEEIYLSSNDPQLSLRKMP